MKGKEAIGAARRREAEADSRAAAALDQLKSERQRNADETNALKSEVRRLRSDHLAEAERIAAVEVRKRMAEAEDARRESGMSDDIAIAMLWHKDRFIHNACKFLSMTRGIYPAEAISWVLAWATDRSLDRNMSPVQMATTLGVPPNGWTIRTWRNDYYEWSQRVGGKVAREPITKTVSLDEALLAGHPDIHPGYQPRWYPPLNYGEMTMDDDLQSA